MSGDGVVIRVVAALAGLGMLAATIPGGSSVARVLVLVGVVAVLLAVLSPATGAAVPAVLIAAAAELTGHASITLACLAGVAALVFLIAVDGRHAMDPARGALPWFANRLGLLIGGIAGAAAAALGGALRAGWGWLTIIGVAAAATAYVLTVLPLSRTEKRST
ncbi:MAG: hypothetical protein ACRDRL_09525, partial [Sciscionella sp.]